MRRGLKLNNWLIFQTAVLGLMVLTSNITNIGVSPTPPVLPETVETKIPMIMPNSRSKSIEKIEKAVTTEEYIRNYFSDIPIMAEIAKCESRFRQHDNTGNILRGEKNRLDRGVMQINEYYHGEDADKLGFDILTIEGNTTYARYLFEKYGVRPWLSSSKCWARSLAYTEYKEIALAK